MQRPARLPSQLSASLYQRLNAYALAASAAGVGVLALTQPADAKVIYTPAHHVIHKNEKYILDLTHHGTGDFGFLIHPFGYSSSRTGFRLFGLGTNTQTANVVSITSRTGTFGFGVAAALKKGSRIPQRGAYGLGATAFLVGNGRSYFGNWFPNVKDRYLGLRFYIDKKKHYGWARLNVRTTEHPFTIHGTLTGYAYETIPNKPIIAGKTKGPDVITIEPASLGHLAAGASAIPAWRVKSTAATTH
jgi:hypothetical protein